MISLIYNNEPFELLPDTKIAIERGNPYLGNNDIEGNISYPLTLPLFPNNVRMLQFRTEFGAAYPGKYDITLIDENGVEEKGIMLLENQDSNFVFPNEGTLSINLKFGISAFAELINNKNLRQFKYGGKRYIAKADLWNNIAARWAQSDDFVFTPIRNEAWAGDDGSTDMMNKLSAVITVPYNGFKLAQMEQQVLMNNPNNADSLVPFFYLQYVIKQILRELDWTYSGEFFNDANWQKVIMLNFQSIKWTDITYQLDPVSNEPVLISNLLQSIEINPSLHMPNVSVAEFFISLRNLAALAIDFDATKQNVTINFLRDFANDAQVIDITRYVKARHQIEFTPEEKLFALSNEIDSNDNGAIQLSLEGKKLQETVDTFSSLPAPLPSMLDHVRYCRRENAFFTVVYNETGAYYEWIHKADNIFSYEPVNYTDKIETKASTVTSYYTEPPNGTPEYSLIPFVKQAGNYYSKVGNYSHWGIRLLFFHGLQLHGFGPSSTYLPFASANNLFNATELAPFNLSYVNGSIYDPADQGLYRTHFYEWFKLIASAERYTIAATIPETVFSKINFNNFLLIHNVPFIIETIRESKPYNGNVEFILRKANFRYTEEIIAPVITCAPPTGIVLQKFDNSITVNWDLVNGEGTYEVLLYSDYGVVQPTVTQNQLPYTFTGLIQNNEYTIQVRTICQNGTDSDFSPPIRFKLFPIKPVRIINNFPNFVVLTIMIEDKLLFSATLSGMTDAIYNLPIPPTGHLKAIAQRYFGNITSDSVLLKIAANYIQQDAIEQYNTQWTAVIWYDPAIQNGFEIHLLPI